MLQLSELAASAAVAADCRLTSDCAACHTRLCCPSPTHPGNHTPEAEGGKGSGYVGRTPVGRCSCTTKWWHSKARVVARAGAPRVTHEKPRRSSRRHTTPAVGRERKSPPCAARVFRQLDSHDGLIRPRHTAAWLETWSLGRPAWSSRDPGLRLSLRDCTCPWAGIACPFQGHTSLPTALSPFVFALD